MDQIRMQPATEAERERAQRADVEAHNRRVEGEARKRAQPVYIRPRAREATPPKVKPPKPPNALELLRLEKQAARQAR